MSPDKKKWLFYLLENNGPKFYGLENIRVRSMKKGQKNLKEKQTITGLPLIIHLKIL